MEVFGRSGAEMLALFSSDGFGEASQQLGSQAQLLAHDATLFDDVSDKLALTGVKAWPPFGVNWTVSSKSGTLQIAMSLRLLGTFESALEPIIPTEGKQPSTNTAILR